MPEVLWLANPHIGALKFVENIQFILRKNMTERNKEYKEGKNEQLNKENEFLNHTLHWLQQLLQTFRILLSAKC